MGEGGDVEVDTVKYIVVVATAKYIVRGHTGDATTHRRWIPLYLRRPDGYGGGYPAAYGVPPVDTLLPSVTLRGGYPTDYGAPATYDDPTGYVYAAPAGYGDYGAGYATAVRTIA